MTPYNNKYIDVYSKQTGSDDLTHYAEQLIESAAKENIPIESNPEKLKHMISHDLRDVLPPQLYELIGLIASAIEDVSEK